MKLLNSRPFQPKGVRKLRSVPAADEIIYVTVVVRPAATVASRDKAMRQLAALKPKARKPLGSDDFIKQQGARRKDLNQIEAFAKRHGLQIVESSREKRCMVLSGTAAAFAKAFRVQFSLHCQEGLTYRSYETGAQVPANIHPIVQAVFGLDNRPLMSHHAFVRAKATTAHTKPEDVAKAYDFPADKNGKGQRIAIVELGGGFHEEDIRKYFESLNLKTPKITVLEISGTKNDPASNELIEKVLDAMGVLTDAEQKSKIPPEDVYHALWTIEATLDVELAGSFANDAEIVVYFAPNDSQGKYNALTTALHSTEHPPTIIACCWGAVEDNLTSDFVQSLDQVFQDAALKGVTICFSSGDKGEDPDKSGTPRAHFPGSSPNVLCCGGTHWESSTKLEEVVWNEKMKTYNPQTGGGVSKFFDTPDWQASADVESKTSKKGRGIPDVAGKADMKTGYGMIVGGHTVTMGGTSSVVPMWAGLIARINQVLGKNVGYITPLLYNADCKDSLTDITEGQTGPNYRAHPGWDPCTGLGTPLGTKLLSILRKQ